MYVVNVLALYHMLESTSPHHIRKGGAGGEARPLHSWQAVELEAKHRCTVLQSTRIFLKDLYFISVCVHLCVHRFVNM